MVNCENKDYIASNIFYCCSLCYEDVKFKMFGWLTLHIGILTIIPLHN